MKLSANQIETHLSLIVYKQNITFEFYFNWN